jgi:flagellar biosynthesis protein FlhG
MNKRKKLGRGIEDFSHLFISSQDTVKGSEKGPITKGLEEVKTCTKTIAVLSRAEGPCNSFLVLNLAIELSNEGKKVALMDTDGRAPHMNLFLESISSSSSLSTSSSRRRKSSCRNQWDIKHILMDVDISSSDYLLPEEKGTIYQNLAEIDADTDIALVFVTSAKIDCLKNIIQNVDDVIISTPSYAVGMVEAYSIVKKVFLLNPDAHVGLIVDELEEGKESYKIFTRMENVVRNHLQKSVHHLGTIYKEPAIEESVRSRIPLSLFKPDSQNVFSFKEMAKAICSNQFGEKTSNPKHNKEKGLAEIFQFDLNGFETQTY